MSNDKQKELKDIVRTSKELSKKLFEQLDKLRRGETTCKESRETSRTAGQTLKNAKQTLKRLKND